ncbi:MAG: glutamate racemase, partial [Acidimicrobiales bacterium]
PAGGPAPAGRLGPLMDDRPIGMFDSGFGGLTVARAVIDLLPAENLVYVGDTGRYPYGPRPLHEVRSYARQIAAKLVREHDAKVVVVACNTAAAAGLDGIGSRGSDSSAGAAFDRDSPTGGAFDQDPPAVPVVSVIEPGLWAALRVTETGRVGVIGTVGTISSGAYQRAVGVLDPDGRVDLTCAACPGFVEFVERGDTGSDQVHVLAERLLAPLRTAKVDTLLLGCTHYPFLARTISDVMGRDVVLVSSADETAFELRAMLQGDDLRRRSRRSGSHLWISSGDVETFRTLGRRLLGPEIDQVEPWDPDAGGRRRDGTGASRYHGGRRLPGSRAQA